jgi:hypothetical protein
VTERLEAKGYRWDAGASVWWREAGDEAPDSSAVGWTTSCIVLTFDRRRRRRYGGEQRSGPAAASRSSSNLRALGQVVLHASDRARIHASVQKQRIQVELDGVNRDGLWSWRLAAARFCAWAAAAEGRGRVRCKRVALGRETSFN